jgi:predicted lipoprotein with Yx(FWY)xxD motif
MRGRVVRLALASLLFAVAGVGAAMAVSASHSGRGTVDTARRGSFGTVLVAANGKVLYRYTPDTKGRSSCGAACAAYWPRLLVASKPTAGPGVKASLLGTIKAPSGKRQVTYAGFPLYYYAGDKSAAQEKGEGYDGTWYLVSPAGALVKHGSASAQTTTTTPTTTSSGGGGGWG